MSTPPTVEQNTYYYSRRQWCRYEMSRKELVGITGELMQADRKSEVLVEGQEVWDEWEQEGGGGEWGTGTEWWKIARQEWRARQKAAVGSRSRWFRERDQTYDRG